MNARSAPPLPRHRASRAALARQRVPLAFSLLSACSLCLHRCGAPRLDGPGGRCHAGPDARFFAAQTDVSDELELLPSFAVSLSGCNLRCDFCITGGPSWNPRAGSPLPLPRLTRLARQALARGARTLMILGGEPTIHLPALLELIAALPEDAPLVLKTNAGFTDPVRPLLAGLVDVWLPDFKFGNPDCAQRLAAIPIAADAWSVVTSNLLWMASDAAARDLIVRHLLMPGHLTCCWQPIARWLASHLPHTKVSLRSGFWPAWQAHRHAELRQPVPPDEWNEALAIAHQHQLRLVP
ncbi:MAG: radical SAM protein [Verrucomicrobiae bacterium]|nr:radical SAM protein [Verrucomicrobiae bacterium]